MAVMLCADDYALTEGVSRGIEELARAGRLSATSALVTTRHWREHSKRISALRAHIQVGLHINLTLGAPLGAMPTLASGPRLPVLGKLVRQSHILNRAQRAEIDAEVRRQVDAFVSATGVSPDFIDGHQHAHVLPGVRIAVLDALDAVFHGQSKPWIRDPADTVTAIVRRGAEPAKSIVIALLARGFGAEARRRGYATNAGFAGVSAFDRDRSYADEVARFFSHAGPAHLIMCHPGHVDDELAALDPVVERRADEFETLARYPHLEGNIVSSGASWFGTRTNPT